MDKIQFEFNKIAGEEVNLNSPKQLREIFIDKLGYKPVKWTSGGASGNKQPSVDESVLKQWVEDGDELAGLVVKLRGLSKTRGTYVDGLIERCDSRLRIHPMLTQAVTVTGRLSSRDPNLQNIPRPDGDVYGLRSAFMPGTGYTLVAADYAQLEMRLLAQMSRDPRMQKVIKDGWDVHMGTASVMYGVPYEKMVKAKKAAGKLEKAKVPLDKWPEDVLLLMGYRQTAKAIGFGINYGKGDNALAADLGITKEEAAERKKEYFAPYPEVEKFIDFTHNYCREFLEVSTILGRKRRLPEADHDWREGFYSRKQRRWVPERPGPTAARALRQDVNSIIQGSAADVARLAQIECEQSEELEALGVRQILQIHDEILFEVPTEYLKEGCGVIKDVMERPFWNLPERLGLDFRELSIPLDVDIGTGEAWSEAH
jgi:DNA polymerase-1